MIAKKKMTKAKDGKSFPDLNKDGKISKADVLVGRGVIKAKKGAAIKKKMQYGGKAASMTSPKPKYPAKLPVKSSAAKPKVGTRMVTLGVDGSMMKSGGKMKKCKYGCK